MTAISMSQDALPILSELVAAAAASVADTASLSRTEAAHALGVKLQVRLWCVL